MGGCRVMLALPAKPSSLNCRQVQIASLDKRMHQVHRTNPASKRLQAIPGFGGIVSTAVAATMTDPKAFKTGREFAAWIGLVPRQSSTGGKERLGSISKLGDRYLRRLLVLGALSIVRRARTRPDKYPGSLPCWAAGRPRWSPWRWPTRWRASPGRYWPRARPIEHRHTKQHSDCGQLIKGLAMECRAALRVYKNVEGDNGMMRTGWTGDRENPLTVKRGRARGFDWDPISGSHQGQRPCAPRKQAGHMTCIRPQADRQKDPGPAGAVHT